MTKLKGFPVADHPLFGEFWDRHVKAFNQLAGKLEQVGIDVAELREVIYTVEDIERLAAQQAIKFARSVIG